MKYRTVRKFTEGTLKGLTHETTHSFYSKPGTRVDKPIGGSPYVIVSCEEVK